MMLSNKFTPIATALVVTGLTAFPLSAFAETASQVTQPSYAPAVTSPAQGVLDLPATSNLTAPAGADTLFVTPSGLTVEGQLPELQSETAKIETSIKDQRVSGSELFAAAQALEAAYVRAGYLLARVTLPPQTIADGMALKLIVTLGYVEGIDASAFDGTTRRRIEAVLQPLVGNRALTNRELERRLLLAGDIPGVLLQSTLKAGEKMGATVIVVDGRANPVLFSASFDNSLSDGLGNYNASLGANFNNMFGLGEVGYVQLGGYPGSKNSMFNSDPRNRQMVVGFTLPLTINGLWLNVEGVDSRTHPTSNLNFTMLDEYQRFSAKLGYNWLRSRNLNTSSEIGFGMSNETQIVEMSKARTDWSKDALRVLRFTQNADMYATWGGFISGNATVSFGLDSFGARQGTTALPMSRSGAEPDFSKLELSGRYSQGLANNQVQWSVAVKGQTSFGNVMASSEQFGLGGFDGLSAFEGGALMGDSGAMVRTELTLPLVLPSIASSPSLGAAVAPYVFGAAGFTELEQVTAVENATNHANSFGVGLRFGVSQVESVLGTTLTLEYAHGNQDNGPSDNRFNLRWLAQF
uniref:Polypeptide-transport-associated domain protein ShlB-type n=1 Tax=Marinomonas sp. (strain MWYL1) TaxID=400668 RepID=A6VSJ0_MARMS